MGLDPGRDLEQTLTVRESVTAMREKRAVVYPGLPALASFKDLA
jgi:hypothetical protein